MRPVAGAPLAAVAIALALAGCGGTNDAPRSQLAGYLTQVDRIERRLGTPVTTIDQVDHQLTASAGRQPTSGPGDPHLTLSTEQRWLQQAAIQIRAVQARLRGLPAPASATHLKALLVDLAGRQADLAVQTRRLAAFMPGLSHSLRPLGPAVVTLERALAVNRAYGAAAVQQVYARKAAALRAFADTLGGILASVDRLRPPTSSQPTYQAERRSLQRMRTASLTLAGDLAGGQTSQIAVVLRAFDRAVALPASRATQQAEAAAIRDYDRRVGQLSALVAAANRERLRLVATVH